MNYINTLTLEYPITYQQLRYERIPHMSFVAASPPYPYALVQEAEEPAYNSFVQVLEEAAPQQVDGVWTQQWTLREATLEEQEERFAAHQEFLESQIQARLDEFARTRGYDSIMSACTYASSKVAQFAAEGQCCVDARDDTWSTCYALLAEVQAGTRPLPMSITDIEADLPVLGWPQ